MNSGRVQPGKAEIHAYNGGLFAEDPLLDSLKISDVLLKKHVSKLTEYDFASEVDTNILGHIFEHSLNDIENVRASLEGTAVDKSKTKRKKDGVFYTPKYITKYIVENTVGKLCKEKKAELGIVDEEFSIGAVYKTKEAEIKRKGELNEKLIKYRNWLLQLSVCDPACGSGAFLNQVLEFLMAEHRYLDELESMLFGTPIVFPNVENHILENNIFGVDINEESVEIARLSLWLRTAQKGRKLSTLSSNIKVGNSLIDDPEVAGELAFNWQNEFPQVFAKGGFDVVVGNPPYGAKISNTDIDYLFNKYQDFGYSKKLNDTYIAFYIKGISELLNIGGLLGYIAPNTWRLVESGISFRNYLFSYSCYLFQIIQHTEKVFEDATVDVDSVFIANQNSEKKEIEIKIGDLRDKVIFHHLFKDRIKGHSSLNLYLTERVYNLKDKIYEQSIKVKDCYTIKNGIKPYEKGKGTPPQTEETMRLKPFTSETKLDESFSPLIGGSSFHKYILLWDNDNWIQYGEWLAAPRDSSIFDESEKLIFRQTSDKIIGTILNNGFIVRNNTHLVLRNENSLYSLKVLLSILNSKLIDFIYWTINPERGEALAEVKAFHLDMLPIPNEIDDPYRLEIIVDKILINKKVLLNIVSSLLMLIDNKYNLINKSTKLQNWPSLDFKAFLGELTKAKVKMSLSEEAEWMAYFKEQKEKALALQSDITRLDREIDQLVYELYGLTEEEIRIVEGGEG